MQQERSTGFLSVSITSHSFKSYLQNELGASSTDGLTELFTATQENNSTSFVTKEEDPEIFFSYKEQHMRSQAIQVPTGEPTDGMKSLSNWLNCFLCRCSNESISY